MRRPLSPLLVLALVGCGRSATQDGAAPASAAPTTAPTVVPVAAPASKAPATAEARPGPTPVPEDAIVPGPVADLPPADRVFGAGEQVIGARGDRLWAAVPKDAGWQVLWVTPHQAGVAHRFAVGDLGQGPRLYVAWGVGRGFLDAPLVLRAHDLTTGEATEIWRNAGQRNEAADLDFQDVDGDGAPDLMFAYFASKYMVKTRHLTQKGSIIEGPEVRMATSRTFGDLDGDGQPDEVVGRVYGDAKGEPGDLTVHFGGGPAVRVPVQNGVKAVMVARLGADTRPTLYVSDGWLADYGKSAKARVSRVTWQGRVPTVELVANSDDEFTFFEMTTADLDGKGQAALVVRGEKRVARFDPAPQGPWAMRPLAGLTPVLNTGLSRRGDAYLVLVPAEPATRAVPVAR